MSTVRAMPPVLVNVTSVSMVSVSAPVEPTSHMPVAALSSAPSISMLFVAAVPVSKLNETMSRLSGVSPSEVRSAKFMVNGSGWGALGDVSVATGSSDSWTVMVISAIALRRTPSTGASCTVYVRDTSLSESSVLVNVISVSMGSTVQVPGVVSVTPVIVIPFDASSPVSNCSVAVIVSPSSGSEAWPARLTVYDPGCLKVFEMSVAVGLMGPDWLMVRVISPDETSGGVDVSSTV